MQEEFVPYNETLELKELGFDDPCLGYWRNEDLPNPITIGQYTTKEDMDYEISGNDEYHNYKNIIALAPLYQQAFRWFNKKYRLHSEITVGVKGFTFSWRPYYDTNGKNPNNSVFDIESFKGQFVWFESFEEAQLTCLQKLIELCKQN